MSGFSVPKETRMYPKLSGLHRSMESLQMPMSLPSAFPSSTPGPTPPAPAAAPPEEETEELTWSGSPRTGQLDRWVDRDTAEPGSVPVPLALFTSTNTGPLIARCDSEHFFTLVK